MVMDALEIRARAILDLHADPIPVAVESGRWFMVREQDALDAIKAALTPPDGFVLVPVESVRPCGCGCDRYCCTHCGAELGGIAARPDALHSPPEGVE